jgi:aminoglycoside 6'-N-acetyltransferase I
LRAALWPEGSAEAHGRELEVILGTGMSGTLPMAIFVSSEESGRLNGFVEVGFRSHADGGDESRPVGYVEGWFVAEGWRRQGIGGELAHTAEEWSRAQGCREMASDALIDNTVSRAWKVGIHRGTPLRALSKNSSGWRQNWRLASQAKSKRK